MATKSRRPNRFRQAIPSVPVRDCVKALKYYCDVLGFKKDFDDAVLGVDRTLFAGVSRDGCALTLSQHDRQRYRLTINFEVDDVDRLYTEYRRRGARIVVAPRDEVWGMRVMRVADLYRHDLFFSSPVRKRTRRVR